MSKELAWETEVWIADIPDHMIHLNGDKCLGPR
ncbi:BsuBI/PstI family type II restriction endonuclease [Prevotella jejuni]